MPEIDGLLPVEQGEQTDSQTDSAAKEQSIFKHLYEAFEEQARQSPELLARAQSSVSGVDPRAVSASSGNSDSDNEEWIRFAKEHIAKDRAGLREEELQQEEAAAAAGSGMSADTKKSMPAELPTGSAASSAATGEEDLLIDEQLNKLEAELKKYEQGISSFSDYNSLRPIIKKLYEVQKDTQISSAILKLLQQIVIDSSYYKIISIYSNINNLLIKYHEAKNDFELYADYRLKICEVLTYCTNNIENIFSLDELKIGTSKRCIDYSYFVNKVFTFISKSGSINPSIYNFCLEIYTNNKWFYNLDQKIYPILIDYYNRQNEEFKFTELKSYYHNLISLNGSEISEDSVIANLQYKLANLYVKSSLTLGDIDREHESINYQELTSFFIRLAESDYNSGFSKLFLTNLKQFVISEDDVNEIANKLVTEISENIDSLPFNLVHIFSQLIINFDLNPEIVSRYINLITENYELKLAELVLQSLNASNYGFNENQILEILNLITIYPDQEILKYVASIIDNFYIKGNSVDEGRLANFVKVKASDCKYKEFLEATSLRNSYINKNFVFEDAADKISANLEIINKFTIYNYSLKKDVFLYLEAVINEKLYEFTPQILALITNFIKSDHNDEASKWFTELFSTYIANGFSLKEITRTFLGYLEFRTDINSDSANYLHNTILNVLAKPLEDRLVVNELATIAYLLLKRGVKVDHQLYKNIAEENYIQIKPELSEIFKELKKNTVVLLNEPPKDVENLFNELKELNLSINVEYFDEVKQILDNYKALINSRIIDNVLAIKEWQVEDIKSWSQRFKPSPFKEDAEEKPKLELEGEVEVGSDSGIEILLDASNLEYLPEILSVFSRASFLANGYYLRDIQIIALVNYVLYQDKSLLSQISTGEGKSAITSFLAIYHGLRLKRVDVITSSSLLAERDAAEQSFLFDLFNLSSSCNSSSLRNTKYSFEECYQADIVYGFINDFQYDYLRSCSMPAHQGKFKFADIAILDEADSLIIDQATNLAKLTASQSGTEHVLRYLCAIYKKLHDINDKIQSIDGELFYEHQYIDPTEDGGQHEIKTEFIKLNSGAKFLYDQLLGFIESSVANDQLPAPYFLKDYIDYHKKYWVKAAIKSLFFELDVDYTISVHPLDGHKIIAPIEKTNTGLVSINSKYQHGLHQFLELKHQLKLSLPTSSANYISILYYLQLYKNIYGMTGTLGEAAEHEYIKTFFDVEFIKIPTYKLKRLKVENSILADNVESWAEAISNRVLDNKNSNRASLVICKTIQEVQLLAEYFLVNGYDSSLIKLYSRNDTNEKDSIHERLVAGQVIIATNLAGRGTDIAISEIVELSGGLEVIVTFMADNIRVEEQAYGRAARQGQPGSALMILNKIQLEQNGYNLDTVSDRINYLKHQRDRNENLRLQYAQHVELPQFLFTDKIYHQYLDFSKSIIPNLNNSNARDVNNYKLMQLRDNWANFVEKINNINFDEDYYDFIEQVASFDYNIVCDSHSIYALYDIIAYELSHNFTVQELFKIALLTILENIEKITDNELNLSKLTSAFEENNQDIISQFLSIILNEENIIEALANALNINFFWLENGSVKQIKVNEEAVHIALALRELSYKPHKTFYLLHYNKSEGQVKIQFNELLKESIISNLLKAESKYLDLIERVTFELEEFNIKANRRELDRFQQQASAMLEEFKATTIRTFDQDSFIVNPSFLIRFARAFSNIRDHGQAVYYYNEAIKRDENFSAVANYYKAYSIIDGKIGDYKQDALDSLIQAVSKIDSIIITDLETVEIIALDKRVMEAENDLCQQISNKKRIYKEVISSIKKTADQIINADSKNEIAINSAFELKYIFSGDEITDFKVELQDVYRSGLIALYDFKEVKPPKDPWKAIGVGLLSAFQVCAGIACAAFGMMPAATTLIAWGIGDAFTTAKIANGMDLSWNNYWKNKSVQVAVTLVTWGVTSAASKLADASKAATETAKNASDAAKGVTNSSAGAASGPSGHAAMQLHKPALEGATQVSTSAAAGNTSFASKLGDVVLMGKSTATGMEAVKLAVAASSVNFATSYAINAVISKQLKNAVKANQGSIQEVINNSIAEHITTEITNQLNYLISLDNSEYCNNRYLMQLSSYLSQLLAREGNILKDIVNGVISNSASAIGSTSMVGVIAETSYRASEAVISYHNIKPHVAKIIAKIANKITELYNAAPSVIDIFNERISYISHEDSSKILETLSRNGLIKHLDGKEYFDSSTKDIAELEFTDISISAAQIRQIFSKLADYHIVIFDDKIAEFKSSTSAMLLQATKTKVEVEIGHQATSQLSSIAENTLKSTTIETVKVSTQTRSINRLKKAAGDIEHAVRESTLAERIIKLPFNFTRAFAETVILKASGSNHYYTAKDEAEIYENHDKIWQQKCREFIVGQANSILQGDELDADLRDILKEAKNLKTGAEEQEAPEHELTEDYDAHFKAYLEMLGQQSVSTSAEAETETTSHLPGNVATDDNPGGASASAGGSESKSAEPEAYPQITPITPDSNLDYHIKSGKGYYLDGDNLVVLDRNDPNFDEASNAAIEKLNAKISAIEAEYDARSADAAEKLGRTSVHAEKYKAAYMKRQVASLLYQPGLSELGLKYLASNAVKLVSNPNSKAALNSLYIIGLTLEYGEHALAGGRGAAMGLARTGTLPGALGGAAYGIVKSFVLRKAIDSLTEVGLNQAAQQMHRTYPTISVVEAELLLSLSLVSSGGKAAIKGVATKFNQAGGLGKATKNMSATIKEVASELGDAMHNMHGPKFAMAGGAGGGGFKQAAKQAGKEALDAGRDAFMSDLDAVKNAAKSAKAATKNTIKTAAEAFTKDPSAKPNAKTGIESATKSAAKTMTKTTAKAATESAAKTTHKSTTDGGIKQGITTEGASKTATEFGKAAGKTSASSSKTVASSAAKMAPDHLAQSAARGAAKAASVKFKASKPSSAVKASASEAAKLKVAADMEERAFATTMAHARGEAVAAPSATAAKIAAKQSDISHKPKASEKPTTHTETKPATEPASGGAAASSAEFKGVTSETKKPYEAQSMAEMLKKKNPEQTVESFTVPELGMPNLKLAGKKHPVTGVVFDSRGFPIFDDHTIFDTRIDLSIAHMRSSERHMKEATKQLKEQILLGKVRRDKFTDVQLNDIFSNSKQIESLTWHHHQDFARMQLIPFDLHQKTAHAGGMKMWPTKEKKSKKI